METTLDNLNRKAAWKSEELLVLKDRINPSFLITQHYNLSLYTVLDTNRELKRERAWSRINLIPLLMAESDRDVYRRDQANLKREKEIMKDVDGWEVSFLVLQVSIYCLYLFSSSLDSLKVLFHKREGRERR